jgi:hypothetical protein
MSNIFVQIASYKDPELKYTIEDLLANAEYPDKLTIAVYNQTDDFSNLDSYRNDKRFHIVDIPWYNSQGVCWARHHLQKLWNNEMYTLQLDSHHRFELNWDTTLIDMLHSVKSKKPILTTYVGNYSPITNKKDYLATILTPDRFTDEGILLLKAEEMPRWKRRNTPFRGSYISGHFIFTYGIFNKEVLYDPTLYFHGEEITLSLRSYTHGYDIYYPHRPVLFHEYTRQGRAKHWEEHTDTNKQKNIIEQSWLERDIKSKNKLKYFFETLNLKILEPYSVGSQRTIEQFEQHAGINFKSCDIHPLAKKRKEYPINDKITWWKRNTKKYTYNLTVPMPKDKYDFIFIGIEDKAGNLLLRQDLSRYQSEITVTFHSKKIPYRYIVWPYEQNGTFKERIDTLL